MNEKVKMIFGCFFISVIFIILGLNGTPGTKAGLQAWYSHSWESWHSSAVSGH